MPFEVRDQIALLGSHTILQQAHYKSTHNYEQQVDQIHTRHAHLYSNSIGTLQLGSGCLTKAC